MNEFATKGENKKQNISNYLNKTNYEYLAIIT